MADPEIILLDEPVAGVNPTLANKIFEKIPAKSHEMKPKFMKTRIEDFLLVVEKQESVVYFVSETLSYPANYDLLCPSRSSNRETVRLAF